MTSIFQALLSGARSLMEPRIPALVLWPVLIAAALWGLLAWLFWNDALALLRAGIEATPARTLLEDPDWAWLPGSLGVVLGVLFLIPAVWVTALMVVAMAAMPVMLNQVARRNYPDLELKRGGTLAGSLWNAATAVGVFALLWLLTLPLWLLGPLALAVPLVLNAYINQRLFCYDALADHASPEEFHQVLKRGGGRLYLLGAIAGLVQFIPVLNLLGPIYIGLVFIHFCLAELQALRAGHGNSTPPASG